MRIGIITNDVPPHYCGIGDHSIYLANAIRSAGEEAVIIAARGKPSENIHVLESDWGYQGLEKLYQKLVSLNLDHLILQFTPLMYLNEKHCVVHDLVDFWKRCARHLKTSIIVHETYFCRLWYPRSWIKGLRERWLLRRMVEFSHFVFTASQPLVDEMVEWRNVANVHLLPIGSNFPVAKQDRAMMRTERGIDADEIVLILFGGGNSLKWMCGHVDATDRLLRVKNISVRWLLLGGVSTGWFHLSSKVITPGRLSEEVVSEWLQATDIFLMPHYAGLCGKRGTLIAAMQHSLPVVGTRTAMTDNYWSEIDGVKLVPMRSRKVFAKTVLELARSQALRDQCGTSNEAYFRNFFRWDGIANLFLKEVR